MADVTHNTLTNDELHEAFHRVAASDPGAIGAGKYWLDTTTTPYILKRRNTGNTAWVTIGSAGAGGGGGAHLVVAANDALQTIKDRADYVCDGINDEVQIVAAINALPSVGGTIELSEGNFSWGSTQTDIFNDNLTIVGQGMGATIIKLANGVNGRMIFNQDGNPVTNVTFRHLTLDFNGINQTDGASRDLRSAMQFNRVHELKLDAIEWTGCRHGAAFRLYACDRTSITNCYAHDNGVQATTVGSHTLPVATITVDSTTGFASAGKIKIGNNVLVYTGKTGTTFTGVSGGTGTMPVGTPAYPVTNDVNEFLLICDANFNGSGQDLQVIGNVFYNNTDTGTAMDGVNRAVVMGNLYRRNALGCGMGFSNTEGTFRTADSCEDITVQGNVIIGLNNAVTENQGVKCADFGNTGDGGNNRRLRFFGNEIRQCDRALWVDDTDDIDISHNHLMDAVGPNKQLLLIATTGQTVNGAYIRNNIFGNSTNRGISFSSGTATRVRITNNEFKTDVSTAVGGTIPTGSDLTVTDNVGYGTSGGGGSMPFIVAASNAPQTWKNTASYQCDGTADQTEINQACIDAGDNGRVLLSPGTFTLSGSVLIDQAGLIFEMTGGELVWSSGITATDPILWVKQSDVKVVNVKVRGSGSKGNGLGIKLVRDPAVVSNGGVHDVQLYNPVISSCDTGIEFGIHTALGDSTGDCNVFGGDISSVKTGVMSRGFVNRLYGTRIATIDTAIDVTDDRASSKIEVYGVTINQWGTLAIRVRRGTGSIFENLWMEHTGGGTAVRAILIGSHTSAGDAGTYEVSDCNFRGTTKLHLSTETEGIRLRNSRGAYFENITLSTNGIAPTSVINVEQYCLGTGNTFKRIDLWPGSGGLQSAAAFSNSIYPLPYVNNSTKEGALVIQEHFDGSGSTINSTIGGNTSPNPMATHSVFKETGNGVTTYYAKDRFGHILVAATDTTTTSGLKAVLNTVLPQTVNDRSICFAPNTRFHFLDAPLGNESWAGVEDHINFAENRNITFFGGGWGTIISNRTNWPTGTDVEPFDFTNCQGIIVRDIQVECCGSLKSTTGALDFDQGVDCVVENVRVLRTRGAQAIVFDGGDAGKYAGRNRVSGCYIQGRPRPPELSLITGGTLSASTEYRYAVSWVDMDLGGAGVSAETMPSSETPITTTSTDKTVDVVIQIGPYSCTARKIYRWDATNGWRLIATVNDNTTITYRDTGSGTPSAVPTAFTEHRSTIMGSGIELLSCQDSLVEGCVCDGVGDKVNGINQYSFNIVRKGTLIGANRNRIVNCTSIHSGGYGFRIAGGSDNMISSCTAINPGTVASKSHFVRIEGITGIPTDRNIVMGFRGIDNQTTASPSGGVSTSNAISITATQTPTNNQLAIITVTGQASTAISDSGTGTVQTAVVTT